MRELNPSELRWHCPPKDTRILKNKKLEDLVVQPRFVEAVKKGVQLPNTHLFITNFRGSYADKTIEALVREFDARPVANDVVCLYNASDPHKPIVAVLPQGYAQQLEQDLATFVNIVKTVPEVIVQEFNKKLAKEYAKLGEVAKKYGIRVTMINPDEYNFKPEGLIVTKEAEKAFQARIQEFADKYLGSFKKKIVQKALGGESWHEFVSKRTTEAVVDAFIALRKRYEQIGSLVEYWSNFERVVVKECVQSASGNKDFSAFKVNILVDNSTATRAPFEVENEPSYMRLVGRLRKKKSKSDDDYTDFLKVIPGSVLKAKDGSLLIDLDALLEQSTSEITYPTLKRILKTGKIKITSPMPTFTESIDIPEIAIDVKVILKGSRRAYRRFCELDADFRELFRVHADFDSVVDNSVMNRRKYATYLANIAKENRLSRLTASARCAVIEYAARRAEEKDKLATDFDELSDLVHEAHLCAGENAKIERADVIEAVRRKTYRTALIYDKEKEWLKKYSLVSVCGKKVGQINCLLVYDLGDFSFGAPGRITAEGGVGDKGVTYSEVEADLAGDILKKSTHIIEGYLTGKYCKNFPLKISAKVTDEQTYGGSDGDSASCATVFALLSQFSKVPIKQNIAMTGAMDKFGNVLVIGGVNEKIEGFYDACVVKGGLTGDQGVLIPEGNVRDLMLREDVVDAVKQGKFHIYTFKNIDDGIPLLLNDQPAAYVHKRVGEELYRLASAYEDFSKKK